MKLFTRLTCLGIAIFFGLVQSWKLDSSCTKDARTQELVEDAINGAFDMANGALNALNEERGNGDIQNVLKWLFLKEDENPANADMSRVMEALQGILDVRTKIDNPHSEDFIVYCDLTRFVKSDDGRYVDTDIEYKLDSEEKHVGNCMKQLPGTLAFTFNPKRRLPSQIQIYPWFINWAKVKRLKTWKDIKTKVVLFGLLRPLSTLGWPFTQIDTLSLFDKVLLHEMTHTRAGYGAVDADKVGTFPFPTAYGWKQCIKLAEQGSDNLKQNPQRNADSIALFCSAVRLIMDPNNPIRVTKNGKLKPITHNNGRIKRWFEPVDLGSLPEEEAMKSGFVTLTRTVSAA